MVLALYILGLASSIALFFSYPPLGYFFIVIMFIGLIAGMKYGELINNKVILFLMRFSYAWLVILLALSIAKTVRSYVVF